MLGVSYSFHRLGHTSFFFSFPDFGSVGRIEKRKGKKKSQEVSKLEGHVPKDETKS